MVYYIKFSILPLTNTLWLHSVTLKLGKNGDVGDEFASINLRSHTVKHWSGTQL